jgi:hypothetical protein
MTDTVADVAASYFDAWKRGDFTRLRAILAISMCSLMWICL